MKPETETHTLAVIGVDIGKEVFHLVAFDVAPRAAVLQCRDESAVPIEDCPPGVKGPVL